MHSRKEYSEWYDSTADQAIANIDRPKKRPHPRGRGGRGKKKLVDVTGRRIVEPLSKFDDPASAKGRRRLLAYLNRQISQTPKSDSETRATLFRDKRNLERKQYFSRTSPTSKF